MSERGVRRFVEALLRGRRPRAFHAEDSDVPELRAAITLRAAAPGSDAPREEFVTSLHGRLAAQLDGAQRAEAEKTPATGTRRRLFVQGTAIAAAAATVGVVLDRTLTSVTPESPPTGQTLTPTTGLWRTVATSEELPDGGVRPFDLGNVVGFVQRTDGVVRAVSGSCTHQGCRLRLDPPTRRLNCPCHTTAFTVSGELLVHQLPIAPAPLPHFQTREVNGAIQVYAPPAPA
ncbi:MAG TPA: Rieske (2Fe-2S) protein [Pseudonocardiaceae bacterium]